MTDMKFAYVQLGSANAAALRDFYVQALDFRPSDDTEWLNGGKGFVLSAPGYGENAPVLGIIPATEGAAAHINDTGCAHLCFETTDVKGAVRRLLKHGGRVISTMQHPELHPCVYCADPEGNIVEFHIPFPSQKTAGEYLTAAGSLLGLLPDRAIRGRGGESGLKFIHVNMIAEDWRKLCDWYESLTASVDFGKRKDHSGSYKSSVIGIEGVHVVGQHILLKGFALDCPTFEIFTYSVKGRTEPAKETELGLNAIGFVSADVKATAKEIAAVGGSLLSLCDDAALLTDIQGTRMYLRGRK